MTKRNPLEGRGPSVFDRLEQSKEDKAREHFKAWFPGVEPLTTGHANLIADVMDRPSPLMTMKTNFDQSLLGRVLTVFSSFSI